MAERILVTGAPALVTISRPDGMKRTYAWVAEQVERES